MSFESISSTPEQRLFSGEVILAREFIDDDVIQQQAIDLINAHELVLGTAPIKNEHKDNAVTGLFERITAAGDLSVVEFEGNQHDIHIATGQRILNSLCMDMPDWDRKRYMLELCEELKVYKVFLLIEKGGLPPDTKVITHSDFPDEEISEQEKHDRGYRTLNKKGMLRSCHFEKQDNGSWIRVLEQISRSNSNDGSTRRWFNENANAVPLHSTGALAEQYLVSANRLPGGVVTLVAELDDIYGTIRLYGESPDGTRPDYWAVRETSREWRDQLQQYTDELAEYENYLQQQRQAGTISYDRHLVLFHKKIDTIIQRILLLAPQFAEDTYGLAAAPHIYEASMAFAAGNYKEAEHSLEKAETHRDSKASISCGGRGAKVPSEVPNQSPSEAVSRAIEDKKNWKWKRGTCAVKTCPTRPGKTKVGPCSVCVSCQHKFDKGSDPTKELVRKESGITTESKIAINALSKVTNERFALAA